VFGDRNSFLEVLPEKVCHKLDQETKLNSGLELIPTWGAVRGEGDKQGMHHRLDFYKISELRKILNMGNIGIKNYKYF
jgi:hypothetical protein